jgi:hypothetical protein
MIGVLSLFLLLSLPFALCPTLQHMLLQLLVLLSFIRCVQVLNPYLSVVFKVIFLIIDDQNLHDLILEEVRAEL